MSSKAPSPLGACRVLKTWLEKDSDSFAALKRVAKRTKTSCLVDVCTTRNGKAGLYLACGDTEEEKEGLSLETRCVRARPLSTLVGCISSLEKFAGFSVMASGQRGARVAKQLRALQPRLKLL